MPLRAAAWLDLLGYVTASPPLNALLALGGPALLLAGRLLDDLEDLIHKAAGWMLREVGRRDEAALSGFLDAHAHRMPRTMLRSAVERLEPGVRRHHMDARRRAGG